MSELLPPSHSTTRRLRPADLLRFNGRASRGEFRAVFNAFLTLLAVVSAVLWGADQLFTGGDGKISRLSLEAILNLAAYSGFFVLAATMDRRMHDFGLRAWWVLLYLIPPIPIVMIAVCWFRRGQPGENKYGPVPPQRVRLW